jgi:hypothetical protein
VPQHLGRDHRRRTAGDYRRQETGRIGRPIGNTGVRKLVTAVGVDAEQIVTTLGIVHTPRTEAEAVIRGRAIAVDADQRAAAVVGDFAELAVPAARKTETLEADEPVTAFPRCAILAFFEACFDNAKPPVADQAIAAVLIDFANLADGLTLLLDAGVVFLGAGEPVTAWEFGAIPADHIDAEWDLVDADIVETDVGATRAVARAAGPGETAVIARLTPFRAEVRAGVLLDILAVHSCVAGLGVRDLACNASHRQRPGPTGQPSQDLTAVQTSAEPLG